MKQYFKLKENLYTKTFGDLPKGLILSQSLWIRILESLQHNIANSDYKLSNNNMFEPCKLLCHDELKQLNNLITHSLNITTMWQNEYNEIING